MPEVLMFAVMLGTVELKIPPRCQGMEQQYRIKRKIFLFAVMLGTVELKKVPPRCQGMEQQLTRYPTIYSQVVGRTLVASFVMNSDQDVRSIIRLLRVLDCSALKTNQV